MTDDRATLSICVPTYNRARHVEALLDRLFAGSGFPFPIEVVLSDNASSDETPAVAARYAARGLPLRYYRMRENVGAERNILSVLRRAKGVFAIALADDDALDPGGVVEAIAWMLAHPECLATYGPIDHYDAVAQTSHWQSYSLEVPVVFAPDQRCDAARFIAQRQIVPEVPILRTGILGDVLLPHKNVYFIYFQILDRLLDLGSVCFRGRPHYRVLLRQWDGDEQRSTVSKHGDFLVWESMYRGALYFHYAALVAGGDRLSPNERLALERDFAVFARSLRNSAIYTLTMARRFSDAVDIVKWLAVCGDLDRKPDVLNRLIAESAAAALFAIVDIFDSIPEFDRIVLYRVGELSTALIRGFRAFRPQIDVQTVEQAGDIGDRDSALVVTTDDTVRDAVIAAGGFPGKTICLPNLLRTFDVRPWLAHAADDVPI